MHNGKENFNWHKTFWVSLIDLCYLIVWYLEHDNITLCISIYFSEKNKKIKYLPHRVIEISELKQNNLDQWLAVW